MWMGTSQEITLGHYFGGFLNSVAVRGLFNSCCIYLKRGDSDISKKDI